MLRYIALVIDMRLKGISCITTTDPTRSTPATLTAVPSSAAVAARADAVAPVHDVATSAPPSSPCSPSGRCTATR